jgi:aspartate aminotransferase-like enzyme
VKDRGYLLDFPRARQAMAKGLTPATPCVPLVFALSAQLDRIAAEGLEKRWQRHADMREITLGWAGEHGFTPFVDNARHRSPTVTCLEASGRDVNQLAETAQSAGYLIDKGYGSIKGKTFRIGHMGDHNPDRLRALLSALE